MKIANYSELLMSNPVKNPAIPASFEDVDPVPA